MKLSTHRKFNMCTLFCLTKLDENRIKIDAFAAANLKMWLNAEKNLPLSKAPIWRLLTASRDLVTVLVNKPVHNLQVGQIWPNFYHFALLDLEFELQSAMFYTANREKKRLCTTCCEFNQGQGVKNNRILVKFDRLVNCEQAYLMEFFISYDLHF